jgi:PiT family inorganic phosphate transporter
MDGEILLWATVAFGLYMAWTIGANDVANAMGTSVGSGALTFRSAILIAAVFELAGAVLVGGHVTDTVRQGIVEPGAFAAEPMQLVIGMFSSLVAAAAWLHLATWRGWPVSTTHAIVGAIAGFGVVAAGWEAIQGASLGLVAASWVVSPLLGGGIALVVFRFIERTILDHARPVAAMRRVGPVLVIPVFTVLTLALVYKGLKNLELDLPLWQALGIGVGIGCVAAVAAAAVLRRTRMDEHDRPAQIRSVERSLVLFQVMTACFVAFAHGSNDVANAVGPMAGVIGTLEHGAVEGSVELPPWVLWLGALGIVVGLATYGFRVIATIGKKITEMTPSRGFSAEFAAATTILLGSKLGLPISTTHTLVGAVIGVGLAKGLRALDLGVIRGIVLSWLVTVPVSALLAALVYLATAGLMGYL